MIFQYEFIADQENVRKHIQECEGRHTQQAIYSTFHDALTQVCFGCKRIRSTIYRAEENNLWEDKTSGTRDVRWVSWEEKRIAEEIMKKAEKKLENYVKRI